MRPFFFPASIALALAIGAAAACFPDFGVTSATDGGGASSGGGSGGSSGGNSSGGGSGGSSGGGGGSSGGGSGGSSSGSIPGDGSVPTLPDGAPVTGDGGSAPYDPNTQVVVPHGSYDFIDYSGMIAMPETFTNDVLFDKTEVTTSQFDAWIQAGMQMPPDGQSLDPGGPYAGQMFWEGGNTWSTYAASIEYKDSTNCTEVQALSSNENVNNDFAYGPTYVGYEANKTTQGNYPITCVNFYQAVAYCWWAGQKRLPTEAEWQYEITGRGRSYTYPWGNGPDPSDCSLLIWRNNGTAANNYNGCNFPKPVGSVPAGASIDGVLDMQGSVEEWIWTATNGDNDFSIPWPPNYAGPNEDAGIDQPREARSGSFFTPNDQSPTKNLDGRAYDNFGTPSTTTFADLGFRCVKSRL